MTAGYGSPPLGRGVNSRIQNRGEESELIAENAPLGYPAVQRNIWREEWSPTSFVTYLYHVGCF